ncbi:MAG: hypothetical protein V9F00_00855 [Nocardioides sp.]
MLLTSMPPLRLGLPAGQSPLYFGHAEENVPFSARTLFMRGNPAFELSLWCGTCPFLFQRKGGANGTMSAEVEPLADLEGPVVAITESILAPFSALIPEGDYLPLLLEVAPTLVAPHDDLDYFTHEQVATWGIDSFWGLPEDPRSLYYRTFQTRVAEDEHLFEFVVPMVPPGWNERGRVQHYIDLMATGVTPTAVALSTLDVCAPASDDESVDYYTHWGLTHFLLDGHHKFEAAAKTSSRLQLLALVSLDGSLAGPDDLLRLPVLLGQPSGAR